MLRRIVNGARTALARRNSALVESSGTARPVRFERLEPRLLLSAGGPPCITEIFADNRGRVILQVEGELNGSTVNANSCRIITAGLDRRFGTGDDVLEGRVAEYDAETGQIRIQANLVADTRYLVQLDSTIIRDVDGFFLDGEFNGAGMPTGNGQSGGSLAFYTKGAQTRIARFDTNAGVMHVELFHDRTPLTVANFLAYANSGRYDDTIVHRSVNDFVIQGGGFNSNNQFTRVQRDPAVLNEPGISNLRGTIAMAKQGGNANSATSEWFFNLGDNSENLDNQNGGFTVFGEITDDEGLAVMDFINGLEEVNASGVNSAFNEIPVLDPSAISGNPNAINPNATVNVERVALLMDMVAAPPEQIQSLSYEYGSNRDAFVTVYDFGGIGRDAIDDILDVRFDGNRVSSITIKGAFPPGALGIAISNATKVGTVKTAGEGRGSELRFIFSNAAIENLNIQGAITGFNLNGLVFGDTFVPEDADGDGSLVEMTSVLINSGVSSRMSVDSLGGDFVAPGGLSSLTVRDRLVGATLMIGAIPNDPFADLDLRLGEVVDTTLDTDTPIGSIRADSWTSTEEGASAINARSAQSINVKGEFGAEVTLTGGLGPTLNALNSVSIGSMNGAAFDINGGVGKVTVKGATTDTVFDADRGLKFSLGDVTGSDFTIGSGLTGLTMGMLTDTRFSATGEVPNIKVDGWEGGMLTVHRLRTLSSGRGVFAADVFVNGASGEGPAVRKMSFAGGTGLGTWDLRGGEVKSITVKGEARDTNIIVRNDLDSFKADTVINTDIFATGDINKVTAQSWNRGDLTFTHLNKFTTTGGDEEGGLFRGRMTGQDVRTISIAGDMRISTLNLNPPLNFLTRPTSLGSLTVGGAMEFVQIKSSGIINSITADCMIDSSILGSAELDAVFPFDPGSVAPFSRVERLTLTSNNRDAVTFKNSYIIMASVGSVTIGSVDPFNFTTPFGIAAGSVEAVNYINDEGPVSLRRPHLVQSPDAFGDFQIRVNFVPPGGF